MGRSLQNYRGKTEFEDNLHSNERVEGVVETLLCGGKKPCDKSQCPNAGQRRPATRKHRKTDSAVDAKKASNSHHHRRTRNQVGIWVSVGMLRCNAGRNGGELRVKGHHRGLVLAELGKLNLVGGYFGGFWKVGNGHLGGLWVRVLGVVSAAIC